MLQGIEAGELSKWLRIVMANSGPGAHRQEVPQRFADYLINLRVAQLDDNGQLTITDKGRLALRMESPDALHKQVDPDDIVEPVTDDEASAAEPGTRTSTGNNTLAAYDGEDDDEDGHCGQGCGHDHRR